jgi:hypothetical protein
MRHILTIFLISIFLFSCETDSKEKINNKETFDYSNFKIGNGELGPIKIGMTIKEAEMHLKGLSREDAQASDFGYGGGSPAYIYYFDNKQILALLPALGTDTVLVIVAIDENLKTKNGLSPVMSSKDLLLTYPDLMVMQDIMNEWEFFEDSKNKWTFVFMTDENSQVGEYPVLEEPSVPKRLMTKSNWLTIRK